MVAQPRVGLELEGVGRLVQRDEGAELRQAGRRAPAALAVMFGSTKFRRPRAGRRRGQQADVVLAEHLARQERHQEARAAGCRATDSRSGPKARPGVSAAGRRLGHDPLHAAEELLEGRQVEVDPLAAGRSPPASRARAAARRRSPRPRPARSAAARRGRRPRRPPDRRRSAPRRRLRAGGERCCRTASQSMSRVPARRSSSRWTTVAPIASRPPTTIPIPIRLALRGMRGV